MWPEGSSARCRVGGRVSEPAGEGRLRGGCGDGRPRGVLRMPSPVTRSLPCERWARLPGQVPQTRRALVTPCGGDGDTGYLTSFGSIMGERVPKREGLNPGYCPLLKFIIFFIRTFQRLSSLKKISLHCGLEGSLKSTSF